MTHNLPYRPKIRLAITYREAWPLPAYTSLVTEPTYRPRTVEAAAEFASRLIEMDASKERVAVHYHVRVAGRWMPVCGVRS